MAEVTAARPGTPPLPRPIRKALGRLDRRLKALAALKALGAAALVAALGAAAGMAADFAWGLPGEARRAVWGVWVLAAAAPVAVAAARGLARRPGALELAAAFERADPALGERLTAAVGLLGGRNAPAHGSPTLIAAQAADAEAHAAGLDPAPAAPAAGARRRLAAGVAAAALVAAPSLVRPEPFGRLAARFLTPWSDVERVGAYAVTVEPGDAVKAIGEDLAVTARVAPRIGRTPSPGGAWLEWTEDGTGQTRRTAMRGTDGRAAEAADGARSFALVLPRLPGSLTYRVATAAGESRRFRVTGVEPPGVEWVVARVEPPAYTNRPASDARDPARIEAWEGSRVTLTVRAKGPIAAAEVTWPRPDEKGGPGRVAATVACACAAEGAAMACDGRTGVFELSAEATGDYAISLRDPAGLVGPRDQPKRRLTVVPDAPPAVAVVGVEGLDVAAADDTLRAGVVADDDVAVASAELYYTVERGSGSGQSGAEPGKIALTLPGLGTASARGEAALGLKALGVAPGDVVSYRVRVADNRPPPRGPNVAWSAANRLTVAAKAEPLWSRRDRASREAIGAKLDALKKAVAENRHETELLRYAADAVSRGNGEWDADRRRGLARREAEARGAVERLDELADVLAGDPSFRPLAPPTRQLADVEAEAARATLDQARQADAAAARLADLRQADARLAAVSARLDDLKRGFDDLAARAADRRRLQALADRQGQVADRAEADAKAEADARHGPDRARLDRLAAEQNAVKNDLDALVKTAPDLRDQLRAAQAAEAEALARRARDLARRQRDQAREGADLSGKAERLKALADEQRAVEADARRLAMDVDAPLVAAGRGRVNTEAVRQAVGPIERGDLDRVAPQLAAAEDDLARVARDLEDAPGDLRDLARRLARRQELIARDVDQALGGLRSGSEIPAEGRAAAAGALAPLAGRQKGVAALARELAEAAAAAGPPTGKDGRVAPPIQAADQAAEAAARAAEAAAAAVNPREITARAGEARDALNRLTTRFPDHGQRDAALRRAVAGARRAADEAAREVETHLRETDRPDDRKAPPAQAAAELARRLAPAAARAREAAEALAAVEPGPRLAPQRDRAARSARALADAAEAVRDQGANPPADPRPLRDALAGSASAARAAAARFEQKVHGKTPADDLADEVAGEQRALVGHPHPPADEQRRLASALRNVNAPDAPLELAEALRRAEAAARIAGGGAGTRPEAVAEAVRRAAEAAGALADRLADRQSPRARVEALARAERALNDPEDPPEPADEVALQRAIAAELARPGLGNDAASGAVRQAAEAAGRAAGPGPPAPTRLAEVRGRAAEALEARAAALPGAPPAGAPVAATPPTPRDPDLGVDPALAGRARDLARRERQVRERLQALLADGAGPQQDVRRDAVALARELAALRDRAAGVSDRARGPADEAAALLGRQAPRAMDEAAARLAQGQPTPARNAQRQAAELAERGAQRADDLAAALRAETPAEPGPDAAADAKHRADPGGLAAAREAMEQASRRLGEARGDGPGSPPDPASLDAARRAVRAAAESLRAAAEASRPGPPGGDGPAQARASAPPSPSSAGPNAAAAGVADPDSLAGLQGQTRAGTGRRWGELPGHLRSEILQTSQGRYREDYARLIQLYFREIAAGSGSGSGEKP